MPPTRTSSARMRRCGPHPGLTPEALEPIYYREALAFIRDQPSAWAWLMLRKVFYTVVPVGPSYRLHSASTSARRCSRTSRCCRSRSWESRGFGDAARCRGRCCWWPSLPCWHASYSFPRSDSASRLSIPPSSCARERGGRCGWQHERPRHHPTYNERENLPLIVTRILDETPYRILVVDDQSPDAPASWRTNWRGRRRSVSTSCTARAGAAWGCRTSTGSSGLSRPTPT